jgi:guanyl-specific ribonuclease Sa
MRDGLPCNTPHGSTSGGAIVAKTVGFGKLERRMLSNDRLPADLRVAVVAFKNQVRCGHDLTIFENREGGLPPAAAGQTYLEYQVGEAHPGDPSPRGKRRLVALVDAGRHILKIYFTDEHYTVGEWMQLQCP